MAVTAPAHGRLPRTRPGCVVVAGMHRSGTSVIAGLLAKLGVQMGTDLVPADGSNPRGYFEDREVVRFHQRAFAARFPPPQSGHADWGWTPDHAIESRDLEPWQPDARRLIERRSAAGPLWGFKDPRASVVLDFWDPLLPQPVYVGVYREPTLVAESMQRLRANVMLRNHAYAWRIWKLYNDRLLAFVRRHRQRCVLINADAIEANLGRLPALLAEQLGVPVRDVDLRGEFAAHLLHASDETSTLQRLARHVWDGCADTYDALEALADVPSGRRPQAFSFPARTAPEALSVVLPTHDDASWLVEALASAIDCTAGRGEILVLDDGTSDPECLRILDRLRAAGQPVLRQENGGLASARNALIAAARGKVILPLDSDNRLRHGFIEQAMDALDREPAVGIVYGDRRLFGSRSELRRVPDFDLRQILSGNYVDACALFRREVWADTGGYDSTLRCLEDWEFWIHAHKRGWRFLHLPVVALDDRVRPGSLLAHMVSKGVTRFRRTLWRKHADLLIGLTPGAIRALARVPAPPPADLARLPLWSRTPATRSSRSQAPLREVSQNLGPGRLDRRGRGVDHEVGPGRHLERIVDAGEVGDLAAPRPRIQALHVAPFAFLEGRGDMDEDEVPAQRAHGLPRRFIR